MSTKILVLLAAILISVNTLAVDSPAWVGPTLIEIVDVQPTGRIYLKIAASTPDLGCPGNTDGWLELNTDANHFDEQFSVLLAAHMGKREVQIHVKLCGHYPYAGNTQLK